jgi:HK97 family phage portal protein
MQTPYGPFNWFYRLWGGGARALRSGDQMRDEGVTALRVSEKGQLEVVGDNFGPIDEDTALSHSPMFAGVQLLCDVMSSLPVFVYTTDAKGNREVARESEEYRLFHRKPNAFMTWADFMSAMVFQYVLYKNSYALVSRDAKSNCIGLMPVPTAQVKQRLNIRTSTLSYVVNIDGVDYEYSQDEVLHIRGFGNGLLGVSTLTCASDTIRMGKEFDKLFSSLYREGGRGSAGVITMPPGVFLTPAQIEKYKASEANNVKIGNARVLEGGMDYKRIVMTPEEYQAIEARGKNIEDTARFLGIPPVLIGHAGGTSMWGTGVSELVQGFQKFTLSPMAVKFQSAFMEFAFSPAQRAKYTIEFEFGGLLRASIEKRFEMYRSGIQSAVIKPDEARQWENLPAADGGEKLYIQGATVPIEKAGQNNGIPQFKTE